MAYEEIIAPNNGCFDDGVLRRAAEFPPSPWGDVLSFHFNNHLVYI